MGTPLRLLIIEDSEDDTQLILREIKRGGYDVEWERVETRANLEAALTQRSWDFVISDHSMPHLSSTQALESVRNSGLDLPFIILSGSIGEDAAVTALKAGAHDFMTKGNLARLIPAVQRELREAENRRERKRAEQARQEAETRYRLLVERIPAIITYVVSSQPPYPTLYISPQVEKILGFTPEEWLKDPGIWERQIHPDDRQRVMAEDQSSHEEHRPFIAEYRIFSRDGHIVWLHDETHHIDDMPGVSPFSQGIELDITERKQAERALQKEKERAQQYLDIAGVMFLVLTTDQNVILINKKGCEILGYTEQEIVGRNWYDHFLPEDEKGRVSAAFDQIMAGEIESVEYVENHVLTKNGQQRLVAWHNSLLTNEAGRIIGVVSSGEDITERKLAEKALFESEHQMRALVTSLDDIVLEVDEQSTYLNVWGTNEKLLVQPKNEIIGHKIADVLGEEYAQQFTQAVSRVLNSGQTEDIEYPLDLATGPHWFLAHISPIISADGSNRTASMLVRDITSRKQAEKALDQQLAELEMLYESGLALGQLSKPDDIGKKIIDLVARRLNWHHITIRLYHPKSETLELLAFDQPDTIDKKELQIIEDRFKSLVTRPGEGLSGWAVQRGQSIRIRDLTHEPRYIEIVSGLRSGMYVPLKIGDRTIGVISIESEQPNAFSESDERLVATLANQAAIALENARLLEEILHQVEQLQALRVIDQTITASLDLNMTLNVVLEQVIRQLNIDSADFLILEPGTQRLQYIAGKGFKTRSIESTSLRLGEGLAGRAALERKIVHVDDLTVDDEHFLRSKLLGEEKFVSYHAVPLITKGKIKGVLEIFNRTHIAQEAEWLGFLEALGTQAAIAVDNASLFQDLQRSNLDLVLAYDATIEGWSHALDLRDKETEGHTLRVTETTLKLARALGMRDEELIHIRRGALLHDIGKMGVPDNILLKPGKLTEAEWVMMRRHPTLAYELLRPIGYLRPALEIPYYHHEKWDGSGYPQGLKGEQIPLAARLFAVVDVWDALSNDRPYRAAWKNEEVMRYLQEQSGKHFDPQVVKLFLEQIGNPSI